MNRELEIIFPPNRSDRDFSVMSIKRYRAAIFEGCDHFNTGSRPGSEKFNQRGPVIRRAISESEPVCAWFLDAALSLSGSSQIAGRPSIQILERRIESPDAAKTGSDRELSHRKIGFI